MTNQNHPSAEGGTAYIAALLLLLVLTVLGLGLTLVTQTEAELGTMEMSVERQFYAANSGMQAATADVIVRQAYAERTYTFADDDKNAALNMRAEVDLSPVLPIRISACNLCSINDAGTYSDGTYQRVNHAMTATARRVAGSGAGQELGRRTLSTMMDLQPFRSPPEALTPLNNASQLAKIKF